MSPRVVCLGLATLDAIFVVPGLPAADGRVVASERVTAGGGPAATAAVALARLGVETAFVGSVGDDDAGRAIRAGLEEEGVDVSCLALVPGARSPQSTILVDDETAQRAIVHHPGSLPPSTAEGRALELCRAADWVHVDHRGYGAAPAGVRLSVDGGNPIPELRAATVALYAPTERQLVTQFGSAKAALAEGAELVVVTRGEQGCAAYLPGGEVISVPRYEIEPVSTLGAGDVFHGALLAGFVRGLGLRSALGAANAAAALSCRALDGRTAIPTAAELEERSRNWHIASE